MAASDNMNNALFQEHMKPEGFRDSCSLCFESYGHRTPKLLPCLHTFCQPCLTLLAKSAGESRAKSKCEETEKEENQTEGPVDDSKEEEGGEEKGDSVEGEGREVEGEGEGGSSPLEITCPTCRAPIPVPEEGIGKMQTNFYLLEAASGPVLCQMCEEDPARDATHVCHKCQQSMCPACKRLHDKITNPREHPVRPVTSRDGVPPQKRDPPAVKCATHVDQDLCFFCKTCDAPVCLHCKLTSHQPHVTEDMTTAGLRGKERVREFLTSARSQIQVLEKAISRLSRNDKELSREKQEVTEEVTAHYDEILRWVKRSRGELLESIEAKAETAGAALRGETGRAKDTLENLSRLASCTIPDSGLQIWALENELRGLLLKEDDLDHYTKIGDAEEQETFLRLTSDPSVLDLGTVRAYMGELETSGETLPALSLTRQVPEARDRTADLEARLKTTEQNFHKALQALQVKQDSTEQNLQGLQVKQDSTEQNLQGLQVKQDSTEQNLQGLQVKQDSTEKLVEQTKTKVDSAETRLDAVQKRVAFNVCPKTALKTPAGDVLIMDHAAVNIGNAYDVTTGVFTAPVAGLYSLQGTVRARSSLTKYLDVPLYIDDKVYGWAVADCKHGYSDQSTVRAVVHLQSGQTACLKNVQPSEVTFYGDVDHPCTSFSGFLAQAD